ncbi:MULTISPECIES: class I SAM-dependent methyltransferase [Bacillota]|uniref:class I SAM-dependent methyltransferase n=1 Tax=Roseburia faecis TaxID=301302 RepID=UPI0018989827|nr:methyltransferase domain-containing protein [Roseburia faecis]
MITEELIRTYPRKRKELPYEYKKIYDQWYEENRKGLTQVTSMSSKLEHWLHKQVANSSDKNKKTLEIGAGTLNQLDFERPQVYDIVEPYKKLYENSSNLKYVRNVYSDISEVTDKKYDRIISVACFEHVENLPDVVQASTELLAPGGKLCVSIPNEGRFLWKFAYTMTTGREFKKLFGLEYETLMRYEHINTADEIEQILKYYYSNVKRSMLGVGKTLSFYRYYECSCPKDKR